MLSTLKLWLWLTSRLDLGSAWAVLEHFGGPEQVFYADRAEYPLVPGLGKKQQALLEDKSTREADEILARCDASGIHILTWQDAEYPESLRGIELPPLVLYLRGRLPRLEDTLCIAMAGTRKASPYGLMKAKEIAYGLTKAGACVVTGIVAGCDASAAEGALLAGGPLVCVVAGGVDVPYYEFPRHLQMLEDIAHCGAIVSAAPPGTAHKGELFSLRNRLMTGLAQGSLCVEAPLRSGTLQVARLAADQGRDVYALLANADAPAAAGTTALLAEGEAIPIRDARDVLSHYPILFPPQQIPVPADMAPPETSAAPSQAASPAPAQPAAPAPAAPQSQDDRPVWPLAQHKGELTDDERDILDTIRDDPQIPDAIAAATGLPARRVSSALTVLTIRGLVKELPGGRFQAAVRLQ